MNYLIASINRRKDDNLLIEPVKSQIHEINHVLDNKLENIGRALDDVNKAYALLEFIFIIAATSSSITHCMLVFSNLPLLESLFKVNREVDNRIQRCEHLMWHCGCKKFLILVFILFFFKLNDKADISDDYHLCWLLKILNWNSLYLNKNAFILYNWLFRSLFEIYILYLIILGWNNFKETFFILLPIISINNVFQA